MPDARANLNAAVEKAGLDLAKASRAIGRNPTYLQQFVQYGKPRRLGQVDRAKLAALLRIEPSDLMDDAEIETMRRLGIAPLTVPQPRRGNVGFHEEQTPLPSPPIETTLPDAFRVEFGKRDLPVYGAAECGPGGVVNFPQDPIEWFWRPPELAGVRDAFAMYAAGDSMSDASVPAGTMVWVQKHRSPAIGRLCLVLKTGEGAFIKQYRGRKGGKVLLYQSNPPKILEWPESEIQAIYRIVGTWEG